MERTVARMRLEVSATQEEVVFGVSGIMKKTDGMDLAGQIQHYSRIHPKKLTLDFTNLASLSSDSVPFVVAALEQSGVGKYNIHALGCNPAVGRTLQDNEFERVGMIG